MADVIDVGHVYRLLLLLQGISFPFPKDGPVYPTIKKGSIVAPFLQHSENSTRSYHGCHLDNSGSGSVRNLPCLEPSFVLS